jgi:hypothetical protein
MAGGAGIRAGPAPAFLPAPSGPGAATPRSASLVRPSLTTVELPSYDRTAGPSQAA